MNSAEITIRPAYADDQVALHRLAALDSAPSVPRHPLLVAEVDGELRVALSAADGRVIADPFFPTAGILSLLRVHAGAGQSGRRVPRTLHAMRGLAGETRAPRRAPAWSR